jgi:hypothetical protein
MSEPTRRGISCQGLDEAFEEEEARKSNLILEAQLLQARQQPDEAAARFAQAAAIEERLSRLCEEKGLIEKAWVHRFGAVRGWALAGNVHDAIALGEGMLARGDLPERLRQRIREYVDVLRQRRAAWSVDLTLVTTGTTV